MSILLNLLLLASLGTMTLSAPLHASVTAEAQTSAQTRLAFTSRDGLNIEYVRYEASSTALRPIVISPGCGESAYRYEELVADLRARGYGPIYVLEHRGQGFSDGTGLRSDVVHVRRFAEYVVDFVDFMRGPVATDLAARGYHGAPDLIAHSMGGAIANLALGADPSLARKVVYVAPMMDINTSILNPMDDRLALWAAELLCAAGFGEKIGVGGLGRARRLKTPGVAQEIAAGIYRGGVSPSWLKESIKATKVIRKQASAHAEPSLMITARRDRLVSNGALRTYAAEAQNCGLLDVDGPHGLHHVPKLTTDPGRRHRRVLQGLRRPPRTLILKRTNAPSIDRSPSAGPRVYRDRRTHPTFQMQILWAWARPGGSHLPRGHAGSDRS